MLKWIKKKKERDRFSLSQNTNDLLESKDDKPSTLNVKSFEFSMEKGGKYLFSIKGTNHNWQVWKTKRELCEFHQKLKDNIKFLSSKEKLSSTVCNIPESEEELPKYFQNLVELIPFMNSLFSDFFKSNFGETDPVTKMVKVIVFEHILKFSIDSSCSFFDFVSICCQKLQVCDLPKSFFYRDSEGDLITVDDEEDFSACIQNTEGHLKLFYTEHME